MWYVVCDEWCVVCSVCFLVCGECDEWLVVCDVIGLPQEIFSDLCRTVSPFTVFSHSSRILLHHSSLRHPFSGLVIPFGSSSLSVPHPFRLAIPAGH